MAGALWNITSGGAVALSAATAKTVLGVKSTGVQVYIKNFRVSFDGITASAVPVLIELANITFATNAPGTNSTTVTPTAVTAAAPTVVFTAAKNWTTEPTVVATQQEFLLTPNGGTLFYDFPLGDELVCNGNADGIGLRLTAPAAVNCRAALTFGRC